MYILYDMAVVSLIAYSKKLLLYGDSRWLSVCSEPFSMADHIKGEEERASVWALNRIILCDEKVKTVK